MGSVFRLWAAEVKTYSPKMGSVCVVGKDPMYPAHMATRVQNANNLILTTECKRFAHRMLPNKPPYRIRPLSLKIIWSLEVNKVIQKVNVVQNVTEAII